MNTKINSLMTCDMTDFDPSKIADTYKLPELNVSCLIDAQCEGMEGLSAVNEATV